MEYPGVVICHTKLCFGVQENTVSPSFVINIAHWPGIWYAVSLCSSDKMLSIMPLQNSQPQLSFKLCPLRWVAHIWVRAAQKKPATYACRRTSWSMKAASVTPGSRQPVIAEKAVSAICRSLGKKFNFLLLIKFPFISRHLPKVNMLWPIKIIIVKKIKCN